MSQIPNYCRSCGYRLEGMERVYCAKTRCQELARAAALLATRKDDPLIRDRKVVHEFEVAMPKELLLKKLEEEAHQHSLEGKSPDLGFMADYVLLIEKIKRHSWDDCSKFLAERSEIKRRMDEAKKAKTRLDRIPFPNLELSGGQTDASSPANNHPDLDRVSYQNYRRHARESVLGFGPTAIAPGDVDAFKGFVQSPFRGSRLMVPSNIGKFFVLHDLCVGRKALESSNPIPMTAFAEHVVDPVHLGFLDARPGLAMTMLVQNISNESHTFSAALIGTSIE